MELQKLLARLRIEEGWRSRLYLDTTGNLTIGYGLNLAKLVLPVGVELEDVRLVPVHGIPQAMGEALLKVEALATVEGLESALPWFNFLDEVRQLVLADMAFNLGVPGLLRWPIFLGQVERGEYTLAAANMRSTLWASQVPGRAGPLIEMMETGQEVPAA